jgi:HEPN domain-containing protein
VADIPEPTGSLLEARRWLAKAHGDLTVASLVLESAAGVNWAACFHAQQATEKSIKALPVATATDFPRSHVLDRLLALLSPAIADEFDLTALAELTPWAVAGRYPEDSANPDLDTTRRLIQAAAAALGTARRLVDAATDATDSDPTTS